MNCGYTTAWRNAENMKAYGIDDCSFLLKYGEAFSNEIRHRIESRLNETNTVIPNYAACSLKKEADYSANTIPSYSCQNDIVQVSPNNLEGEYHSNFDLSYLRESSNNNEQDLITITIDVKLKWDNVWVLNNNITLTAVNFDAIKQSDNSALTWYSNNHSFLYNRMDANYKVYRSIIQVRDSDGQYMSDDTYEAAMNLVVTDSVNTIYIPFFFSFTLVNGVITTNFS